MSRSNPDGPAVIVDPYSSGGMYAPAFTAAGVPVRIVRCDGMIHGFLRWSGSVPAARSLIDAITSAARDALAGRV